ncbi:metal-dependent transcriptional regulator [Chloroflexota bacterium]
MELEEKAEEILETLWIRIEEEKVKHLSLNDLGTTEKEPVEQLVALGYITVADNQVRLTSRGRLEAADVVRRHRLAERLLSDVLGTKEDSLIHEKACKFEHLLHQGLDESICALLGHPKVCPHGKPIPPGRCCQQETRQASWLISPLSHLTQGQKGRVAYIYAPELNKLQKLMAMGILPGAPVSLIQTFPSYVFRVHQTQFAVDKEIAEAIYIRLVEETNIVAAPPHRHGWRRRLGHFSRWCPKGRQP